jgi:hypothetical protein
MDRDRGIAFALFTMLGAALFVFVVAHWAALTNGYVINDDVRQQVYWMQAWVDPELYGDDLLTRYARNYVPWGVQALYAVATPFVNPIYFSKILTGILFVLTAGFLFALGLALQDLLAAVLVVCVSFLFGGFLDQISGGLSRAFVYPLLAAHLFFLNQGMIVTASTVILLESVLNPYVLVLSLGTQALFFAHRYGRGVLLELSRRLFPAGKGQTSESESCKGTNVGQLPVTRLVASCSIVALAVVLAALKYVILKAPEFGSAVTRAQMAGGVEYTAAGRYEIIPGPSIWFELIRPLVPYPETGTLSIVVGCVLFALMVGTTLWVFSRPRSFLNLRGLGIFVYLLIASFLLYAVADVVLMKIFLPRRYVEFSLALFYCVLIAACLRVVIDELHLKRSAFPFLIAGLVLVGAVRLQGVGVKDYSKDAELYQFLEHTPKTAVAAGHPELMDNVPTFARRPAFVTYELSHSWYDCYWELIKKRTFDFFEAYYSSDEETIRRFGKKNGITYLVVRESDFSPETLKSKAVYFEPFGDYIRKLTAQSKDFAVLDAGRFPPVFHRNGIRVIKLD